MKASVTTLTPLTHQRKSPDKKTIEESLKFVMNMLSCSYSQLLASDSGVGKGVFKRANYWESDHPPMNILAKQIGLGVFFLLCGRE